MGGLEHLADALSRFEGGVVLVSHDELLIRRVLASSDHSELLICSGGAIHHESGLQGLTAYRRAAFREQHLRSEAAARAAEQRLHASRQGRPRGRRPHSISTASTRESTPNERSDVQAEEVQEAPAKEQVTLNVLFKNRTAKKPKSVNLNRKSG